MEEGNSIYSIPQSTIDWLLASQTPSIRYLTYTQLLNRPPSDSDVKANHAEITTSDYIKAIVAQQEDSGYWYSEAKYYQPKFRGSHWSMLLMSELAVPPNFPAMQKGAQFLLGRMAQTEDVYHSIPSYFDENEIGFCCFWGNWLRYQIYCGNLDHPLVQKVIDFVCRDVHRCGKCRYNAELPCAWGVIRSLFGLALIPDDQRTEQVHQAIARGIQFILEDFDLLEANYPSRGEIHTIWHKLSFPLFYHTDILFTLRVLAELNALGHISAKPALDWLDGKRKKDGTCWRGGNPFKSRSHPVLVLPDTPSHWVTLHALSVLSAANRQIAE